MIESYRCVLADPPWKYGDQLTMSSGGAAAQYRTVMETDDVCALARFLDDGRRVAWTIMDRVIAEDAFLFLWVTEPFLLNGDGVRVCKAWGFEPKQRFTWIKGDVRDDAIVGALGMGHVFRVDTESLIVATRGRAASMTMRHDLRNYTFVAPKTGHSRKPSLHALIETLVPGPYLELFARERVDGWDAIGDELPPLTVDAGDTI